MGVITKNHCVGDEIKFPVYGWIRGRVSTPRIMTGTIEAIYPVGDEGAFTATVRVKHRGLYYVDTICD